MNLKIVRISSRENKIIRYLNEEENPHSYPFVCAKDDLLCVKLSCLRILFWVTIACGKSKVRMRKLAYFRYTEVFLIDSTFYSQIFLREFLSQTLASTLFLPPLEPIEAPFDPFRPLTMRSLEVKFTSYNIYFTIVSPILVRFTSFSFENELWMMTLWYVWILVVPWRFIEAKSKFEVLKEFRSAPFNPLDAWMCETWEKKKKTTIQ